MQSVSGRTDTVDGRRDREAFRGVQEHVAKGNRPSTQLVVADQRGPPHPGRIGIAQSRAHGPRAYADHRWHTPPS